MRLCRDLRKIKSRQAQTDETAEKAVKEILADVRARGDAAVRKYTERFDGPAGKSVRVSEGEIQSAVSNVGVDFMRILRRAYDQLTEYHVNQIERSWSIYKENGVIMGQIVRPVQRVALYVPGGTAPYPSTVLMNAVPAAIAGVKEIAVFTPAGTDGKVADAILAAAACCGIDVIYKIGGAQAIAAAAYGTETIPKFHKIVGPGNIYVAAAKRMVYGAVDIDMIAGPSEIMIIADETANPKYIAADMMSQAEHDLYSSAILVTTDETVIKETEAEIVRQAGGLARKEIILSSLENFGAAILAENLDHAFEIANDTAPEHLEILTENPFEKLSKVQNAGSVFIGENTPEPLGDYMSGTNHVLPTCGTAKFHSPLGVYDFVKRSAYSCYPREVLSEMKDDVIKFARMEGLDAHANSVEVRFND